MLYFNIKDRDHYEKLNKDITSCLDFISKGDLGSLEDGQHKLTNEISYNVLNYKTSLPNEREWEAHRQYIDIQTIIDGTERIDYQDISIMKQGEYKIDEDFLQINGESNFSIEMKKNDVLILYPEDAHKTGICLGKAESLRKVVFKVKVTE